MKTLYLDMDGVVADWAAGVEQIVGYRINDPKVFFPPEDWEKIRSSGRLFKDLPKMQQADQLVNLARQLRDRHEWQLLFLTAVPHYNDIHWAFWDKMLWAQEYYPDIPVHFGPYSSDKEKHCLPGDVLIDDRPDNCKQWTDKGGRAIHVKYDDYNSALLELEQLLYLEDIKNKRY